MGSRCGGSGIVVADAGEGGESRGMDAVTTTPVPVNETVRTYAPGSPERATLEKRVAELAGERRRAHVTIGGQQRMGGGERIDVVQPHARRQVLGTTAQGHHGGRAAAVEAARGRGAGVARADLRRPRRGLPQGRRPAGRAVARHAQRRDDARASPRPSYQAEIDAACELIDFWRFNVAFARQILAEQPTQLPGGVEPRSTTARSRVSSTPSRRSTSRRSPATCRPRRR